MKKILYISLLIPFLGTLNSCVEDFESNFSENTTERYLNAEREYLDYLKTPGANFVFQYYPDDNQSYGGYNYFLKFTEDNHVIAEDEASSTPQESTFRVLQSGGAVLSFDLYNKDLHKFATPSGSEYRAKRGDFEFLILRKSNDTLYLKGRKTGNYLKLFIQKDIDSYANNIRTIAEKLGKLDFPLAGEFSNTPIELEAAGDRNFTINYQDITSKKIPYIFTENGIHFYKPIELNGKKYETLVFNSAEKTLESEDGLLVVNLKFVPIDFKNKAWIFDMSDSENFSPNFKKARSKDVLRHSMAVRSGVELEKYYVLGNYRDNIGFNTFVTVNKTLKLTMATNALKFTTDDTDDEVIHIQKGDAILSAWYLNKVNNLLNEITKNSPYRVQKESDRFKLISVNNGDIWFYIKQF
ncbi:DUF4302 domain-containing protein [Ornithobacterium rhinotracheale]|uniref:DUF4302 domain-containing protein n=1 Tax=Ornithobacterium rhinotracheale TaxID=28251 RepID=UPI00129CB12E|nr:DUF4302 domain-containing protein [Ornithobacterium rhinotracheale]MRJ10413.1 DUF4302 domain-containing protein [Ornithobacterium rhinotracheale]